MELSFTYIYGTRRHYKQCRDECFKVSELVRIKTCKCNSGDESTQRNNTALTTTSESSYENIRCYCETAILYCLYRAKSLLISYTELNDNVRF